MFVLGLLRSAWVAAALFPLSANRAMAAAAQKVYETIPHEGSVKSLLGAMQPRSQLYDVLNYEAYERMYDEFQAQPAR